MYTWRGKGFLCHSDKDKKKREDNIALRYKREAFAKEVIKELRNSKIFGSGIHVEEILKRCEAKFDAYLADASFYALRDRLTSVRKDVKSGNMSNMPTVDELMNIMYKTGKEYFDIYK